MSRWRILVVLLICVTAAQMLSAVRPSWLPLYLHAPNSLLRPLVMIGLATGLLVLLLKCGKDLPRTECLALLIGTAGGLANLVDILRLGAVVDFVPLAPGVLASPGDFLIASGFLSFVPLSLRHARKGRGLYGLYRHWRDMIRLRFVARVT